MGWGRERAVMCLPQEVKRCGTIILSLSTQFNNGGDRGE